MTDRQRRIQTLYEISLSIGPKATLTETADDALLEYLQKLNCSVGAVFQHHTTPDGSEYDTIVTIPADPESNATLQAMIDALPDGASDESLADQLPISDHTDDGAHFCLQELPDFGVLALGKHGGEIDDITRSSLRPLNEKLAEACRSKLIERRHRIERNRFEAVFDAIPEPVVNTVVDDGVERVKQVNTPFESVFGHSAAAARGQPIETLITPVDGEETGEQTEPTAVGGDEPATASYETEDGPCEFLVRRVAVGGPEADEYIHLYVDISVEKQHQQELERYERLVENLPIGVYRTTAGTDGEFRLVNQGLVDILEASSAGEFETISVSEIYAEGASREQFSDLLVEQGAVEDVELELRTLNGNTIWATVTGRAVEEDGETVFELALQDITERKERQQQLAVLNRVLRHNVRNAMNVIKGNTRLLSEAVETSEQSFIDAIERRVENLEQLSNKAGTMRSLFDQGREVTAIIEMEQLLEEVRADFESKHPEAELTVAVFNSIAVQADVRLKMAIHELLDNAVDHNDSPEPEVTVTVAPAESKPPDHWADITITDNGPGIHEDEWKAIESGQETPLQHGTGLGLWLVYWTVSLLGGEITISGLDSGTRIVLTLPRATGDQPPSQVD